MRCLMRGSCVAQAMLEAHPGHPELYAELYSILPRAHAHLGQQPPTEAELTAWLKAHEWHANQGEAGAVRCGPARKATQPPLLAPGPRLTPNT